MKQFKELRFIHQANFVEVFGRVEYVLDPGSNVGRTPRTLLRAALLGRCGERREVWFLPVS